MDIFAAAEALADTSMDFGVEANMGTNVNNNDNNEDITVASAFNKYADMHNDIENKDNNDDNNIINNNDNEYNNDNNNDSNNINVITPDNTVPMIPESNGNSTHNNINGNINGNNNKLNGSSNGNKKLLNPNDNDARSQNKKAVVKKLESGGRILSLIKKAEQKRVAKRKIITFLKKKGVSEQKIIEAYQEYYKQEKLYEITFNERPLGFSVIMDTRGKNAIVSSIQDGNNKRLGMKVASRMYEVNGKRVDGLKHRDILKTISSQSTPFYVVFREARKNHKALKKIEQEREQGLKWQDEKEVNNDNNNDDDDDDDDESYSSDDDAAHVAQHYNRKKTVKKKKPNNGSIGLFKVNEVGYWDDGDVQKEQNEMLKELSRLMMGMAVAQTDNNLVTDAPKTINGMTHKRQKTLKKLLDVSQSDTDPNGDNTDNNNHGTSNGNAKKKNNNGRSLNSRSMSITQNDINKLMGNEDETRNDDDYDKEIFKCLNDLIGTDGSNGGGAPMTPTTEVMMREFFGNEDEDEYDNNNNNDNKMDNDDDILNSLTKGETLMKYGKFGKPKYKTFQLTKDKKSLVWFSKKKNIDDTTIPIAQIRKILIGDESNLNKSTRKNRDVINASFTIYYGDSNTKVKDLKKLTVTAKNEKVAFIWANGLKILADAARKGKNLSELNREELSTEFRKKKLQSKHRKTNSVIISLDNLKKNSVSNLFSTKSTVSAQQLIKSHERTKTNLNKCVEFVTSKRNWKAITAAGQFENLKNTMNTLDKRLREIHKSVTMGDKSEYNALKAELFSVNADIDALKQKLTAIVRKPKAL